MHQFQREYHRIIHRNTRIRLSIRKGFAISNISYTITYTSFNVNVTISNVAIHGINPCIHEGVTISSTPHTVPCTSSITNVTISNIVIRGMYLSIHEGFITFNISYI